MSSFPLLPASTVALQSNLLNSKTDAVDLYASLNTKWFKSNIYDWEQDTSNLNKQGEPKIEILNKKIQEPTLID